MATRWHKPLQTCRALREQPENAFSATLLIQAGTSPCSLHRQITMGCWRTKIFSSTGWRETKSALAFERKRLQADALTCPDSKTEAKHDARNSPAIDVLEEGWSA